MMSGSSLKDAQRPLRLLSLDGGGVRGLSSIVILKHIMKGVSAARGRTVHPWEEFDMIGGTSTGGLIAVMLGRLRMSLDECQDAYLKLSERIFKPKHDDSNVSRPNHAEDKGGYFDSRQLEEAIKETIKERGTSENALLQDPASPCKVFVCAVSTSNTGVAILRSYENTEMPELLYEECKIWEACRATSASTTFFDPITIGPFDQKFADGGILYNNPIQLVHREAQCIWPTRFADALLVSIGTGDAPGMAFEGDAKKIVEYMKKIVTQTVKVNNDFFSDHGSMVKRNLLFRFTIAHGLADIGLEEYKEKAKMVNATQAYLGDWETRERVKACRDQISLLQNENPSRIQVPDVPLTALHDACSEGDLGKISLLLQASADINALDSRGFTPLMIACEKDDLDLVKFLLSKGADTQKDYSTEHSPVGLAISNSNTEMVKVLFDNGVPVDRRNKFRIVAGFTTREYQFTPLGQAVVKGDESLVELMLKRGADVNAKQGELGWTPLYHAVYNRHEAAIRLLLQYKAKINITDSRGNTPLVPRGYTGRKTSKEGHDWFANLKILIEDWLSKGMYAESAELLAQPVGVLSRAVNKAVIQQTNANVASAYPHPAQVTRNSNPQLISSQPVAMNYGSPNPQPVAGTFLPPNPQPVYELPLNTRPRPVNAHVPASTSGRPELLHEVGSPTNRATAVNPNPIVANTNLQVRPKEVKKAGIFGLLRRG